MKSNLIILMCLLAATTGFSQDENLPKPELTEVWEPVPKIVEPSAKPGDPPSDAIVLFNGKNLDEWMSPKSNGPAQWTLSDGVITVKKGTGPIRTKRSFTDFQFHLEYRIPANITGSGQARVRCRSAGRPGGPSRRGSWRRPAGRRRGGSCRRPSRG